MPEVRGSQTWVMPGEKAAVKADHAKKRLQGFDVRCRLKGKEGLDMERKGTKTAQGNLMAKKADPPTGKKQRIFQD